MKQYTRDRVTDMNNTKPEQRRMNVAKKTYKCKTSNFRMHHYYIVQ